MVFSSTRPLQLSTLFVRPADPAAVQLWVVGLSVAAGLLLLLLLTLALRRVSGGLRYSTRPYSTQQRLSLLSRPWVLAGGVLRQEEGAH